MARLFYLLVMTGIVTFGACDDIRRPPQITRSPLSKNDTGIRIFIPGEQNVYLHCEGTGFPHPTFHWLFNGKKLQFNHRQNMRMSNPKQGTIHITQLSILDKGFYQCIASNLYGQALSHAIFLQYAELETTKTTDVEDVTVNEGEPLRISCKPVKCIPPPVYSWQIGKSATVKQWSTLNTNDKRINIDEYGNLYFSYVMKKDDQGGNVYKCNTFNNYLDLQGGGSYTRIKVNPGSQHEIAPTLRHPTKGKENTVVLLGDNLRLRCIFAGKSVEHWVVNVPLSKTKHNLTVLGTSKNNNETTAYTGSTIYFRPAPVISWDRIDGQIRPDREIISSDQSLIIKKVQHNDEGTYTCKGQNSKGQSPKIRFFVEVEERPTFVKTPKSINITEGKNAVFECEARGEPKVKIQWLKNGKEIDGTNTDRRITISKDGKTLTVQKVRKTIPGSPNNIGDLMNVQCNASNKHGYKFADAYLNVIKPIVLTQTPEDQHVTTNTSDQVTLTCAATADDSTPLKIEWLKDGLEIADKGRTTDLNNGTLVLNFQGAKDGGKSLAGVYTCEVTNGGYDQKTASVNVTVTRPPLPDELNKGSLERFWWLFVIAVALILLIIFLLFCILWCCKKPDGEDYLVDELERKDGNNPEEELMFIGFHQFQRPEDKPIKGSRASLGSLAMSLDSEESLNEYAGARAATGTYERNTRKASFDYDGVFAN